MTAASYRVLNILLVGAVICVFMHADARADSVEAVLARVQSLEREIAAIKKENEALRQIRRLREEKASLMPRQQVANVGSRTPQERVAIRDPRESYAADAPLHVTAAPPVSVASWTGLYVGGHVGGARANSDVISTMLPGSIYANPSNLALVDALGTGGLGDSSFVGGGQIGFNYQFTPNWLIGLEADVSSTSLDISRLATGTATTGAVTVINSLTADWLATFRGRFGFTSDRLLVYATGGLALTDFKYTQSFDVPSGPSLSSGSSTVGSKGLATGWSVGGGLEHVLAYGWSMKAEYLYARFDFDPLDTTTLLCSPGCTRFSQLLRGTTADRAEIHMGRFGLNYKFSETAIAKQ